MTEFWCEGCGDRFEGEAPIQVTERYTISAAVRALAAAEGTWGAITAGQTEKVLHFDFDTAACYQAWQAREVAWKAEHAVDGTAAEAEVKARYAALLAAQ